jgi:hypothetical protein
LPILGYAADSGHSADADALDGASRSMKLLSRIIRSSVPDFAGLASRFRLQLSIGNPVI